MKEYDKRKSHIRVISKLDVICVSSGNVRHPVTKTTLHFTPLHYICRQFTLI